MKPHTQISEHLEICSLLVSANNSYSRLEEDFEILTGIHLSHSTHQRLVHRQEFEEIICETPVEVICIDGGKARIRTVKVVLWQGRVDEAITLFSDCKLETVPKFIAYLVKHHHRIPNYHYCAIRGIYDWLWNCGIGD